MSSWQLRSSMYVLLSRSVFFSVFLAWVLVFPAKLSAVTSFEAGFRSYDVDGRAWAVACADFNADGKIDVAAVGDVFSQQGHVTILMGEGDGTLRQQQTLSVEKEPRYLSVGDLDHNNTVDIVVSNHRSATLSIFYGAGDGNFSPGPVLSTVLSPGHSAVGDFNSDGHTDIFVVSTSSLVNRAAVYYGNAQGGFAPAKFFSSPRSWSRVSAIDLDEDGDLDVVFGGGWFRNENGTLEPHRTLALNAVDIALGDWNADGHLDAAVVDGSRLKVSLGNGQAVFSQIDVHETARYGDSFRIISGQFDDDEFLDLVISNGREQRMLSFFGRGDGTFRRGEDIPAQNPPWLEAADLDDDGKDDIVAGTAFREMISVFLSNRHGGFGNRIDIPTDESRGFGHATADLDGDGLPDLVTVHSSLTVNVFHNTGGENFSLHEPLVLSRPADAVAIGDLNNDLFPDIVVSGGFNGGIISIFMQTSGEFVLQQELFVGPNPADLELIDVNGDKRLDVVSIFSASGTGPGGVTVHLGTEDGLFAEPIVTRSAWKPAEFSSGDFNEDGRLDLVIADRGSIAKVFLGNGDGSFEVKNIGQIGSWAITSADFNQDGHIDVAFGIGVYTFNGEVVIFNGRGDGTFSESSRFGVEEPLSVFAADLDRDDVPELIVGSLRSLGPSVVSVYPSLGDAGFGVPARYGVGWGVSQVTAMDINQDGSRDLIVSNIFDGTISVLPGDRTNPITPVTLSDFTVHVQDGFAKLSWTMDATELLDVRGIDVVRAHDIEGPYQMRTSAPLAPATRMEFADTGVEPGATYWYRLNMLLQDGTLEASIALEASIPSLFANRLLGTFLQSGTIGIRYEISNTVPVRLGVFDVRGRLVAGLVRGRQGPGRYVSHWEPRIGDRRTPRGVYFVRLQAGRYRSTLKVPLLQN